MNKKIFLGTISAFAAYTATAVAQNEADKAKRPNILYIMCDDMGYGDLGCYGQQLISTPNIDRLATQGMRFTQAYAGSPVSAPSRATFMTGQHSGHTHVRGNKEYWGGTQKADPRYNNLVEYQVAGQEPYSTDHVIIPEIFKDNGYTTGMFGKWAGGYEGSVSTPDKRGIDEYYGFICQFQAHLYYPNFLNEYSSSAGDTETHRVTMEQNIQHAMYGGDYNQRAQYSADLIHQRALKWLDSQSEDQPFLGIFTYTLPHAELQQPDDEILQAYKDKFCDCEEKTFSGDQGSRYNPTMIAHAQFAGMITRLDQQVGEIMAKLEEKGLADNTVLIFTSDNGPHEEGGADPTFFNRDGLLRGVKRSVHEGGIRIPFIVRWPGKVEAGSVSDHQFAFYDLMATFCDIAGIENYEQKYTNPKLTNDWFDGISIYPTLTGEGTQQSHEALYWEFHETNMIGVRKGNWKLVVKAGVCELYDLATDVHEDNNLASTYPEIVEDLKAVIKREHTNSSLFNVTLPKDN
ncbi:MAG: arylsulfatase [Prevotellaceae bacterium]|nr:arylsulfatase [Prevotellaceae bacterium]